MAVQAVIFDWGGTLTPWHTVDHAALWRDVCTLHFAEELAERDAAAIRAAESELWRVAESESRSATMDHVFERAGVVPTEAFLASYFEAWEPHTLTDPDVAELLPLLRAAGILSADAASLRTGHGLPPSTAAQRGSRRRRIAFHPRPRIDAQRQSRQGDRDPGPVDPCLDLRHLPDRVHPRTRRLDLGYGRREQRCTQVEPGSRHLVVKGMTYLSPEISGYQQGMLTSRRQRPHG
jgi:hypothetical protein